MQIANRAKVPPSATLTMSSRAIQKKQQGEYVYNFATGDPIIPNHPKVLNAALDAVKTGLSPYPAVAGIPDLREAAPAWLNRTYGTQFKASQTVVTCGGKFALYALAQALLNPGDAALLIAPYWVSYPGIVQMAEGEPVIIETSQQTGWKTSADEIGKKLTKRVKFLLLNNGCNPTGAIYTKNELAAILAVCQKAGVLVISDEVYSELVYVDTPYISCGSFPEFQENVVVVQSCSKNFAMAGWRVGFAFGPEALIKQIVSIQGQSTTGTSIQSQRAALAAVENGAEVAKYVREVMKARRALFIDSFEKHFHKKFAPPASAVYAFMSLSDLGWKGSDSLAYCERVLDQCNVALVPGSAFGKEGYVRFAFSELEHDITEGLKALAFIQ